MNGIYHGLAVPIPCPHCAYVIEQSVGEPQRNQYCPRCGLNMTVHDGPRHAAEASILEKLSEMLRKNK